MTMKYEVLRGQAKVGSYDFDELKALYQAGVLLPADIFLDSRHDRLEAAVILAGTEACTRGFAAGGVGRSRSDPRQLRRRVPRRDFY